MCVGCVRGGCVGGGSWLLSHLTENPLCVLEGCWEGEAPVPEVQPSLGQNRLHGPAAASRGRLTPPDRAGWGWGWSCENPGKLGVM